MRARRRRAAAAAAPSRPAPAGSRCTPKLLIAEPKNTGVCRPARKRARSNGGLALREQLDVVAQCRRPRRAKSSSRRGFVEALDPLDVLRDAFLAGREAHQPVVEQVRTRRGSAWPMPSGQRDRRAVDAQHRLDLLEQRERLAHLAVHLVDERDDRRVAQPAHLEQLDRLRLDALRRVDHHHRRVDRGEHAVGVLGEVLVARACRAG